MGVPRGHQWEPVHPGVGELKGAEFEPCLPTKIVEIANTVEAVQDGRIYVELINGPFLFREKGTPDEYKAGLDLVDRARLAVLHESGTDQGAFREFYEGSPQRLQPRWLRLSHRYALRARIPTKARIQQSRRQALAVWPKAPRSATILSPIAELAGNLRL